MLVTLWFVCLYLFAVCSVEGGLCNHMGLPLQREIKKGGAEIFNLEMNPSFQLLQGLDTLRKLFLLLSFQGLEMGREEQPSSLPVS